MYSTSIIRSMYYNNVASLYSLVIVLSSHETLCVSRRRAQSSFSTFSDARFGVRCCRGIAQFRLMLPLSLLLVAPPVRFCCFLAPPLAGHRANYRDKGGPCARQPKLKLPKGPSCPKGSSHVLEGNQAIRPWPCGKQPRRRRGTPPLARRRLCVCEGSLSRQAAAY